MAGHASVIDLAAVSLGSSIWLAIMVTLIGFLTASSPLIAQTMGADRRQDVAELVRQALWQGLMLAIIAMGLVQLLLPLFSHLDLHPLAAERARGFLLAISWGLPGLTVLRALTSYSTSLSRSWPPMVVSLANLLLNIALNWVLIYGHFGLPALGAVGCGVATAVCMSFSALALALWIRLDPFYQGTHPFDRWSWPQRTLQLRLIRLGAPIGMVFLVEVSAFSLVALLMARLGEVSVSAHQIALNFTALIFMAPSSLGTALTVRVGQALGAGDREHARFIGLNGIYLGWLYALFSGVLIAWNGDAIASLYTPDKAVQQLAAALLVYAGLFQFADVTQTTAAGALRGYAITREPMLIYVAAFWLVGLPLGYVLTFGAPGWAGLGARGYWLALVLALFLAGGLLYRLFQRVSRADNDPA